MAPCLTKGDRILKMPNHALMSVLADRTPYSDLIYK